MHRRGKVWGYPVNKKLLVSQEGNLQLDFFYKQSIESTFFHVYLFLFLVPSMHPLVYSLLYLTPSVCSLLSMQSLYFYHFQYAVVPCIYFSVYSHILCVLIYLQPLPSIVYSLNQCSQSFIPVKACRRSVHLASILQTLKGIQITVRLKRRRESYRQSPMGYMSFFWPNPISSSYENNALNLSSGRFLSIFYG